MKRITFLGAFLALFAFQANAQLDINSLMERFEQHKNSPGNITEFFTTEEIQAISEHISANAAVTSPQPSNRGGVTGYGWESQSLGYGSYNVASPDPYTFIAIGSGTADFESSGAIDPADNTTAYVGDNAGEMWSVDVATGTYTSLGNTGIIDATGFEFDTNSGTLYMTTTTDFYSIDLTTSPPTANFIGILGTGGAVAIALAIDGAGVGYTYDIVDDTFYTIDLGTGAATAVGGIGFDASFGQGMFWDSDSDTVYLASLNAGAGNLGELRTVDVATGATTLVGEWVPGVVTQVAWSSVANPLLNVDEDALTQISIFPNPASDVLNIKVPSNIQIESASIFDVLGKESLVQVINGQINVQNLSQGVYILNLRTSAGTLTQKVVKR